MVKSLMNDVADRFYRFALRQHERLVLKRFKFVHVMSNGLHSFGVVKFIKRNFDEGEHCFIFPSMSDFMRKKMLGEKNVYAHGLDALCSGGDYVVIFHGLFSDEPIIFLNENDWLLRKSYWFIWGGDLYNAPDNYANNKVRKEFAGILTTFDRDVYFDKYGANNFFDISYPHEMTFDMVPDDVVRDKCIHIQVNNSADETTLEMLHVLAKFRDENIKITTILSYVSNSHEDVRARIVREGYDIFGEKFNPMMKFLPVEEYAAHLASVDIYISNQDRQQGNGNAAFVCALGGKVFIKSAVSVYKKYNEIGIRYFDSADIAGMTFDEFLFRDPVERKNTQGLLLDRMNESTKVKQWGGFFDSVRD